MGHSLIRGCDKARVRRNGVELADKFRGKFENILVKISQWDQGGGKSIQIQEHTISGVHDPCKTLGVVFYSNQPRMGGGGPQAQIPVFTLNAGRCRF